jgi:hypothetical protein
VGVGDVDAVVALNWRHQANLSPHHFIQGLIFQKLKDWKQLTIFNQ